MCPGICHDNYSRASALYWSRVGSAGVRAVAMYGAGCGAGSLCWLAVQFLMHVWA